MPRRRPDDAYSEAIYVLMNKFGWTLKQIKQLPLPSFFEIVKLMERENKENKRRNYGASRKY
jgi:hypothetical protein